MNDPSIQNFPHVIPISTAHGDLEAQLYMSAKKKAGNSPVANVWQTVIRKWYQKSIWAFQFPRR
jgi:hypothetical protein